MADKKITELNEIGAGVLASGDYFVVVDTDATTTKKLDADNVAEQIVTTFTKTILDDADASTVQSTLGLSALAKTLIDDANASAFLTTLGLDTDLLTLSLPASTTVASIGEKLIEDANAAANIAELDIKEWAFSSNIDASAGTETTLELITGMSAATEVEIYLRLVSTDTAAEPFVIQIGGASGYKSTNYLCTGVRLAGTTLAEDGAYTDGFYVGQDDITAAQHYSGCVNLYRLGPSVHWWFYEGTCHYSTGHIIWNAGYVNLAEDMTKIQMTTNGGVAVFDNGNLQLRWR